jgi:ABC-type nitrate/sulfonate/bicarbonate transport system substrate-binding protein
MAVAIKNIKREGTAMNRMGCSGWALALVCSLLVPASAWPAEMLRVGKAGREAFSFVPSDVGVRAGIFRKHGVDLEISSFGGDARVQQALTAEGIDIGLGSGPGLAFLVKGVPAKGIAAMADPPQTFALVVRNDDSIKSIDDLKGRNVGVSTVGSVTGWLVGETARRKGWGYDGMAMTPIGDDAARVAAVKTRSIDAAVVNLAVAFKFAQGGDGRVLTLFGDFIRDFHVHVIFATDKAIATRGETLRRFLAGWFETIALMRGDKARTIDIAREIMGTDEVMTAAIYDAMMPMFNEDGRFKPAALAVLSRSFVDMKTLPAEPDMARLIDESFLPTR